MPGVDRHLCPLLALATAYAAGAFNNQRHHEDEMNYLFPFLANVKSPVEKISTYLKQQAPGSTHATYSRYVASDLDPNPSSMGMRVGGVSTFLERARCWCRAW